MVASWVRLLHSGPQDVRLLPKLGPKDVSAFVRVLVRAGRMTTQWNRIDFQQTPTLGTTATVRLPVQGELLTRLQLVTTMPDIWVDQNRAHIAAENLGKTFAGPQFGWTNSLGHALIQQATLEIGGSRVEQIDGRLLEAHDEFDTPLEKVLNKNDLICRKDNGFTTETQGNSPVPQQVVTPLPFWFSRGDLGAALPIDALHVDEVRLSITFRPVSSLQVSNTQSTTDLTTLTNAEGTGQWPMAESKFQVQDPSGNVNPLLGGTVSQIPGVAMPSRFPLGDTQLMAQYVQLDKPEANRFRQGELMIPLTQHQTIDPQDTRNFSQVRIPLEISNPARNLFFQSQLFQAPALNAFFLATRDLSKPAQADANPAPWWPDASGLNTETALPLIPAQSTVASEPLSFIELIYEGSQVRTSTDNCALQRSILPSLEERKSPWHNRQMYCIPFGMQAGQYGGTLPMGHCNLNRINKKELLLGFVAGRGSSAPPRQIVQVWLETQNVLRIQGGRAAMMFAY